MIQGITLNQDKNHFLTEEQNNKLRQKRIRAESISQHRKYMVNSLKHIILRNLKAIISLGNGFYFLVFFFIFFPGLNAFNKLAGEATLSEICTTLKNPINSAITKEIFGERRVRRLCSNCISCGQIYDLQGK